MNEAMKAKVDENIEAVRRRVYECVERARLALDMKVDSYDSEREQRQEFGRAQHSLVNFGLDGLLDYLGLELPDHRWHLNWEGEEDPQGSYFFWKWEYPTLQSAKDRMKFEQLQREDDIRRAAEESKERRRQERAARKNRAVKA